MILAVGTEKQFHSLCEVLGLRLRDEWETNKGRVKDRERLQQTLSEQMVKWNYKILSERLVEGGIPFAQIYNIGEALSTEAAEAHILESHQEGRMLRALKTVTFELSEE